MSKPRRKKRKVSETFEEGDVMRVKATGALVRLAHSQDQDDYSLIDESGYVYVDPVEEIADWYHIDELERVKP